MIQKVVVVRGLTLAALLALGPLSATADASSILLNGSFETPVVPYGSYTSFASGSSAIDGWTVIGYPAPNGDVAIINQHLAPIYPSQDGQQWLDLTGTTNSIASGVQQTVATTAGNSYLLSFWVGSIYNFAHGGVASSTVKVDLNGVAAGLFANPANFSTLTWQQFFLPFVATSGLTTVAFINQDPWNDGENGLDNVSLEAAGPTVVPEPASLLLFGTGLAFGARRLRKRQPKAA